MTRRPLSRSAIAALNRESWCAAATIARAYSRQSYRCRPSSIARITMAAYELGLPVPRRARRRTK
jgi:hypothetical protein